MEQQKNQLEEETHGHHAGYESAGRDNIKEAGHAINNFTAYIHTQTLVEEIRRDYG